MSIVYLNGTYCEQKDAKISVLDRGFLFGDSVYEVIPVFKNVMFGGREHFDRLKKSLAAVFIENPFTNFHELEKIVNALLEKNNLNNKNAKIYIQISRGTEKERSHRIPKDIKPTVVILCDPLHDTSATEIEAGFKAITHTDIRRDNNFIKSTALVANVLLLEKALEKGAIETILLRNGFVLECTSSNLFVVKDGTLMTPPLSELILAGVTRSMILKYANEIGIPVKEAEISEETLRSSDEIFVSASIKELRPIITLDDRAVGSGKTGPIWKKLNDCYQNHKGAHS